MHRRNTLSLLAILALLLTLLPSGVMAQGPELPAAPPVPLQFVEANAVEQADAGKAGSPGTALDGLAVPDGIDFFHEVEPNNTTATATALPGSDTVVLGNVFPNGDLDFFSFSGNAGDRVYAATMTSQSASASVDSFLTLLASDGTTVLEDDNDNGSFGTTSSSIAGATLPANGMYYLQVRHNSATSQLRPYRLHLRVQSGAPVAESEPNDTTATANPLPPSGWVSGETSSAADIDFFALTLNAGDSVFLSLDLDPERDTTEWNAQLGLGVFNNFILVVNDAGTTGPDSEAFFMTVKDAGTYYVIVSPPTGGTTFGTYHLSASVQPQAQQVNCTTYTSTDVPVVIPTGPGVVQSTLTVPGNPRIADIDVSLQLTHTFMADLDAHLVSPAGNDNGLFTDVGNTTVGSANIEMNTTLDDEAALPIGQFTVVAGPRYTPELNYRLSWYDYTDAGGTWTLKLYDDATGDGGVLQSWSITVCEPSPPPTCPAGFDPVTVYSSDFEADDGGFTHSGTQDEWERGLPTFAPITTCNSGSNCWKTDLDNTYNASSNQTLLSPPINLAGLTGPVILRWAQKYQIESASFDGAFVQVQEAGGANPTRLWTWLDATMTNSVGNPTTTIQESAGWGERWADVSTYAGQNIEALFNLSSDTTVQLAGLAIDDVSVTACQPIPSNPAISLDKTVGTDPNVCATTDEITLPYGGGDVTYCYEVTNTGDVSFNTHDLVDSELGNILAGLNYLLTPSASVFVTETTNIAVTTVNTATWTAYNLFEGGGVTATDVATVTVELPSPAITLDKTVGTDPNVCATTDEITLPAGGGAVTYCYEVTNTGDATLNLHDLVDSELGSILSGFPYALAPSASAFLTETTNIAVTTVNTATWTAYNAGPINQVSATDTATVTVPGPRVPNIDVFPLSLSSSQPPNVVMQDTLTITNTGGGTLNWQIFEEPVVIPTAPAGAQPTAPSAWQPDEAVERSGEDGVTPATLPTRDAAAHAAARRLLLTTGLLLIPDSTNDRVMAFDPTTGNLVDADFIPADPTNLSTPKNAILSASGDSILVADQIDDVVQEYDLDGNYLGVFAPAGGVNTAILDNIIGIDLQPNGNLLVTVTGGTNQDSVAEFDTSGNYLGNFVANAAGGLDGPFDVYPRTADWLVPGINSDNVLSFDLTGAPLGVFAGSVAFGEQVAGASNSNVLVANFSTPNSGVMEFTSAGTPVAVYGIVTGNRGVYELPNGNILTTNGSGVFEIDRSNTVVSTKFTGGGAQYIEYVAPPTVCTNLVDVPWLSVAPAAGANSGGVATPVTVSFDSTSLAAGTYTANLCVDSNDPDPGPGNGTDLVVVPVTLTVLTPTALTMGDIALATPPALPAPAALPVAAVPLAGSLALLAAYWLRRKR